MSTASSRDPAPQGGGSAQPWLASYPPGVDWAAAMPVRPLHAMLDETVRRFPDRPAFDFLGKVTRYRELGQMVDAAAAGLQAMGLAKGDRVGLMLPNTLAYVICYFATLKAGGVVVNFNPMYAERELAYQIGDAEPKFMVTMDLSVMLPKLAKVIEAAGTSCSVERVIVCSMAAALPFPKSLLFPIAKAKDMAKLPPGERFVRLETLLKAGGAPQPVSCDPLTDLAVLQYTGGTTGVPKGAMLSHANLVANTEQSVLWFSLEAETPQRMLAVLPFFHVFALTVVLNVGIRLGACIIALPRFQIDETLKTIHAKKPTMFPAVPTIYTAINTHPDQAKYDLSSIRCCMSGGAALPVEVKETFERLTGCVLIEGYGLSESSPVATGNVPGPKTVAGSIGLPIPGTTIEIVSTEDRQTVLGIGETGEVCIRGPQVMLGYWRHPEESAAALVEGRLHTADVGYMDAAGYTYIVDRLKDIIIASGYKMYPRRIEEEIYHHPAVAECVVAGLPDAYRGQTVKAWIRLRDGERLDQATLSQFLKDRLAPMEIPKLVEFRETPLPKTLIGKLSRKALLDEEAARHAA